MEEDQNPVQSPEQKTIVLGFYKYVKLRDVEKLKTDLKELCDNLNMRGSILLAEEGINASVSGSKESIGEFKNYLGKMSEFSDLFFKEEGTFEHPFKKMKVKVKDEIVAFKCDVDLAKTGRHISADELAELYEGGKLKENVVVLDARNDYEYQVGRFKDAIHLDINVFRDFKDKVEKLKSEKDKKIVMYCTGGIRCEKASAYLKTQGFGDVSQLNQGIIQFGKESKKGIWEGKCFVFDKRMVSGMNNEGEPISECLTCNKKCDFQRNCKNVKCNLFYVSCLDCESELHGCCSKECKKVFGEQKFK